MKRYLLDTIHIGEAIGRLSIVRDRLQRNGLGEDLGRDTTMTTSVTGNVSEADLRERFRRLAAEWHEQSRYLSNTAQMALLKPYQSIIGMGRPAVPLILEELRREPGQWFWALEAITGENPVPPDACGKVRLMAEAWLEWGKQRGLLTS